MTKKNSVAVNLLHILPERVGGSEEYSVGTLKAVAENGFEELNPVLHIAR